MASRLCNLDAVMLGRRFFLGFLEPSLSGDGGGSCPGLTEQTPKGLTERSEVSQYDPMHECYVCQAREASTYSDGLLITAMKMGLFTHFGMQQRSGYSIVRVNM